MLLLLLLALTRQFWTLMNCALAVFRPTLNTLWSSVGDDFLYGHTETSSLSSVREFSSRALHFSLDASTIFSPQVLFSFVCPTYVLFCRDFIHRIEFISCTVTLAGSITHAFLFWLLRLPSSQNKMFCCCFFLFNGPLETNYLKHNGPTLPNFQNW